jgi:hypothetical protein
MSTGTIREVAMRYAARMDVFAETKSQSNAWPSRPLLTDNCSILDRGQYPGTEMMILWFRVFPTKRWLKTKRLPAALTTK